MVGGRTEIGSFPEGCSSQSRSYRFGYSYAVKIPVTHSFPPRFPQPQQPANQRPHHKAQGFVTGVARHWVCCNPTMKIDTTKKKRCLHSPLSINLTSSYFPCTLFRTKFLILSFSVRILSCSFVTLMAKLEESGTEMSFCCTFLPDLLKKVNLTPPSFLL